MEVTLTFGLAKQIQYSHVLLTTVLLCRIKAGHNEQESDIHFKNQIQHPVGINFGTSTDKLIFSNASFEAFTAVMFQVDVFWVVTPCSVAVRRQRFGGPCPTLPRHYTAS